MKAAFASALVNFLWQGVLLGALAWLGFSLARTPRIRYAVGITTLALMAVAPIVTGVVFARASEVHGPSSTVHGSLTSQAPGSRSGSVDLERGTVDVREPWTMDDGRWTLTIGQPIDARVATTVLIVWLMGVVALSIRLVFGWLGIRTVTRRVSATGARVQTVANRLISQLGIRATVRVVESTIVRVPAVVGAFKPVVLLPAAAMSGLTMEQVEALLAHELAHVRRHDYLVNLLQSAVETLLFYHPAVWLVSRRVRQERELCCDDLALAVCGDRVAYASALADLESLRAMPSPALAATGGSLLTRVRRILGHDEVSALAGRSQSVAGIAILVSIALLAGGQAARARAAEDSRRAEWSPTPPQGSNVSGRAAWSPTPPQGSQPQKPAQAVVGGVQGGVAEGVVGGVPGGVQGGVADQKPELIVEADDDSRRLAIGDEILVWVRSPINQPEFSTQKFKIQPDGTVRLPHLSGPLHLAGLNVGDARQLISRTLIDEKQYVNPVVDVSLVAGKAEEPKEITPEPQVIGPFRVGDHIRIDVGDPQASDSFRLFATIQPDGTVATSTENPEWAFAVAKLKIAGETSNTIAAVIADRYRVRNLPVPPIEVTFDDRNQAANASRYARRGEPAPSPQTTAVAPKGISVTVQGAVRGPGSVMLREDRLTVPDAISAAGGFLPNAGQRVFVKRRNTPDLTLSKNGLLQGQYSDIKLVDGDTVFVEIAQHFTVTGYVNNPSSQLNWEPGMTLQRALALAGGSMTKAIDPALMAGFAAESRKAWQRATVETTTKQIAWDALTRIDLSGDPVTASHAAPAFAADRVVADYNQQILNRERDKKELIDVQKLGLENPHVKSVESDLAIVRAQLKGRLMQIVDTARQEFENAKAAEMRYQQLYEMQKAQANSESGAGAPNRAAIERKDPKTGKVVYVKLNKDPMTTPILPGDVIRVPKRRL